MSICLIGPVLAAADPAHVTRDTTAAAAAMAARYTDGLWGPLVVKDPSQKQYPVDLVVTMNDWYHQESGVLLEQYMAPEAEGNEPTPYTVSLSCQVQCRNLQEFRLLTP